MTNPWMHYLIWPLVKFLVAFVIVQVIVAAMNWIERRLLGLMQARLGPNRVGSEIGIPWGLGQILADPIKFLLKEDIVPSSAEKVAYYLGPMMSILPALIVFCLIPYGPPPTFAPTQVNVGLLLILALTSTSVYGIILGGWASNNKYSLMGALRSAAQMVSYEVPFGLSIVGVLMISGSLDLVKIVRYQEMHVWNLFPQLIEIQAHFKARVVRGNGGQAAAWDQHKKSQHPERPPGPLGRRAGALLGCGPQTSGHGAGTSLLDLIGRAVVGTLMIFPEETVIGDFGRARLLRDLSLLRVPSEL